MAGWYTFTTTVLVALLLSGCHANTNTTINGNITLSTNTSALNTSTSPTPPTTTITQTNLSTSSVSIQESQTTAFDLEGAKLANQVTVKFYTLKLSKFNEDEYSKLLAEKVTEYCEQMLSECKLSQRIVFMMENVINSNLRQIAKNLELSTVIVYNNESTSIVLSKDSLTTILKQNRESFRQTVGRDMIEVGGESFHIKADERANVIISVTFALITLVLLVAALILRDNHNKIENKNRKQLFLLQHKKKEQDGQTYKIRPGPEPMVRFPSTGRSLVRKTSTETNSTAPANGSRFTTGDAEQGGHVNLAADFPNRMKLQPLLVEEDSTQHEKKKKKKKKKSKRKDRESTEEKNLNEVDSTQQA